MRFTLALSLTLGVSGPTYAQINDDFVTANRIFGQQTPASVLNDIDGEWLPLTTLSNLRGGDPEPGVIAALLERICGNDPARGAVLKAIDQASFEMVAPNSGGELVYRFDWISGAQFHRSVDPEILFGVLKLDKIEGEKGIEARARALQSIASPVTFYRVSPDLIALATQQRVEIHGRCPG